MHGHMNAKWIWKHKNKQLIKHVQTFEPSPLPLTLQSVYTLFFIMSAASASNLAPSAFFWRNFCCEALFQQLTQTYAPVALTPRRAALVTKRSDENTCHLMKWPNMFTMFTNTVKWWEACTTLLSWHQMTSQVVWQVTALSLLRKYLSAFRTVCTTYDLFETSGHSVTSQKTRKRRRENHRFHTNFISGLPTIWTPVELWKSAYLMQET
jgi:hypothetical protein